MLCDGGILVTWPGIEPKPLLWKRGVITSGLPGKLLKLFFRKPHPGTCHSLSTGWKRISRHRVFWKRVSLWKIKSRDKGGTAYLSGQSPERPGRGDAFHGLGANFDSLKTKKIPAGRVALGDWLGWVFLPHVGSVSSVGSGGLLAVVTVGLSRFQRWPWFWLHLSGLGTRFQTYDLGMDSTAQTGIWGPAFLPPCQHPIIT